MKKQMFLLLVPVAFFCKESMAQVEGNSQMAAPAAMGNYEYANKSMANSQYNVSADMANAQYNYQQNQNTSRVPVTAAYPLDGEFTLKVNGLMNAVATNYVAVFNIVQLGLTAKSTDSTMNSTIEEFKENLQKLSIDTSDIKVDMISFVPKYGYQSDKKIFSKKYNEVPDGFELEKNIYVRFKKSSALDGILSAAASAEIYDLVKVDYFLPNAQRLIDSLRLKCLLELKSRVKSYDLIGFELDTLKKTMADNLTTIFPQTRYYSYSAFTRPSFASLKKRPADQPFVSEYTKPISRYYSQVDYDGYDIVLNPVITEPVVQLSYSIVVKYFLKGEPVVPKPKKVYYI
ncbi:MAG TPA: SIMPL domain-containing protein, partial [Bacteroidia bacterium]|nr:SIMPL domain-containing protein [Bacteroidia bacterium]